MTNGPRPGERTARRYLLAAFVLTVGLLVGVMLVLSKLGCCPGGTTHVKAKLFGQEVEVTYVAPEEKAELYGVELGTGEGTGQ